MNEPQEHARLADFIRGHQTSIVSEWTEFARSKTPASDKMSKLALEDHIHEILHYLADDLESLQTPSGSIAKSRGEAPDSPLVQSVGNIHAALRLADGFDIDQMVSEYRALRASVVKRWTAHNRILAETDIEDLTRFNEAIDQTVTQSVAYYTKTINNSRNIFLAILGHDLRNPIGAASMGAKWIMRSGGNEQLAKYASEIVLATDRASHILNDLLQLAQSSFGTDIPILKAQMDMEALCLEIAGEFRALHGENSVKVSREGDARGQWDKSRIGQVVSNLLANAFQHGDPSSPIRVLVVGGEADLMVKVQNAGSPIPPERLKTIFHSWMNGRVAEGAREGLHLGIGLYIARLIIEAHGGKIDVTSTLADGTVFSFCLPRSQCLG